MVGLEKLEPHEFALGAGDGLGGDGGQSGDFAEPFLNLVQDGERTLAVFLRGLRMNFGEPGKGCGPVVEHGVVLHGTGTERVTPVVGAYVQVGKLLVVMRELVMGKAWEIRGPIPEKLGGGRMRIVRALLFLEPGKLHVEKADQLLDCLLVVQIGEGELEQVSSLVGPLPAGYVHAEVEVGFPSFRKQAVHFGVQFQDHLIEGGGFGKSQLHAFAGKDSLQRLHLAFESLLERFLHSLLSFR